MKRVIACLALCLISSAAYCASATPKFTPRTAQQDVACMIKVLNSLPGIDHVKTGFDMYGGGRYRYVEYRYVDKTGHDYGSVRFAAHPNSALDGHPDAYMATLANGVTAERSDGRPVKGDDMGVNKVINQWKARCGVGAGAISF